MMRLEGDCEGAYSRQGCHRDYCHLSFVVQDELKLSSHNDHERIICEIKRAWWWHVCGGGNERGSSLRA